MIHSSKNPANPNSDNDGTGKLHLELIAILSLNTLHSHLLNLTSEEKGSIIIYGFYN